MGHSRNKDFIKFIFDFYDVNKDGEVTIIDLIFFYTYLPMNTQFGQEINSAIELFYNKIIMKKGRRPGIINEEIFQELFPELP